MASELPLDLQKLAIRIALQGKRCRAAMNPEAAKRLRNEKCGPVAEHAEIFFHINKIPELFAETATVLIILAAGKDSYRLTQGIHGALDAFVDDVF